MLYFSCNADIGIRTYVKRIFTSQQNHQAMQESKNSIELEYQKKLGELTLEANARQAANEELLRRHRRRIYWLVFVYLIVVVLNATGVVTLFVLTALSKINIPYEVLGGWALGSGGLGAGSLLFRKPLEKLF